MDQRRSYRSSSFQSNKRCIFITVVILGTLIGCALLGYTAFALKTGNSTIQQVAFMFRHGDRTPTETYPKDPHINYKWEDGWGALTKVPFLHIFSRNNQRLSPNIAKGMRQLYDLGQWIRKEYSQIIDYKYQSANTVVRSSYADRCIMSAQALLAGLYPPAPDEMFIAGLAWRPIPVHSTPKELDKLIAVKSPCPRLEVALKKAYANVSSKKGKKFVTYSEELETHSGANMSTITDIEFLYNTLEIEEMNGLGLPEWTNKYYNKEMRDIAAESLATFTSNTLQRRLRGGPLLKEILERMKDTHMKTYKTTYLYSVHDITLVNVLRAMGFTNELYKPDYGAMLIYELHSINGGTEQAVKIKYVDNWKATTVRDMKIPGCGEPCLLQDLINTWKDVIPDNWDTECQQ